MIFYIIPHPEINFSTYIIQLATCVLIGSDIQAFSNLANEVE